MISPRTLAAVVVVASVFCVSAQPVHASEVTGSLTTSVPSQVGDTLTGTVTSPAPSESSGGGGGGGSSDSSIIYGDRVGGGIIKLPVQKTATTTSTTTGHVLGASTYKFGRDLALGSKGEDVTALQAILIKGTYLSIDAPTGYFGVLTRAAVMRYQAAHSISVVGRVGPLTRAVLSASI